MKTQHPHQLDNAPRRRTTTTALRALAAITLLTAVVGGACVRSDPSSTAPAATAPTSTTTAAVQAKSIDCVALSASMPFKFEAANYWDHDFKIIPNQKDLQACARACDESADCKVVTFADSTIGGNWANTCVLRNAIGPRHTEAPGFCSWVKPAKAAH